MFVREHMVVSVCGTTHSAPCGAEGVKQQGKSLKGHTHTRTHKCTLFTYMTSEDVTSDWLISQYYGAFNSPR